MLSETTIKTMLNENFMFLQQVANRFIAYVHESSSQQLQMSFFINFYVEDILQQATESTLRYERGA